MATESQKVGIVNSWSLVSFAKSHGRMKIADFTNRETNEKFRSCAFVSTDNKITLVGFSGKLGEMSAPQIAGMKDDLQVVELQSGNYKLCKKGSDSWQDVDLGF